MTLRKASMCNRATKKAENLMEYRLRQSWATSLQTNRKEKMKFLSCLTLGSYQPNLTLSDKVSFLLNFNLFYPLFKDHKVQVEKYMKTSSAPFCHLPRFLCTTQIDWAPLFSSFIRVISMCVIGRPVIITESVFLLNSLAKRVYLSFF